MLDGKIWGFNPQAKHAIANCRQTVSPMLPPGEYKRGDGWAFHSDSAFYQITLGVVSNIVMCCYNYQQCYFDSLCIHYVDA